MVAKMRGFLVSFFCLSVLILVEAGGFIEDQKLDGNNFANDAMIQPAYSWPPSGLEGNIQPYPFTQYPLASPCQGSVDCNNVGTSPCSGSVNCNPCGNSVQPPRELTHTIQVPIRVPKVIPVKTSKRVPASPKLEYFAPVSDTETICPANHKMENNSTECVDNMEPICPTSFEWRNNVCVKVLITCPVDHNAVNETCVAKIICPTNYILQGKVCIAPTPICKVGWRWNGEICVIERSVCPANYRKNREGKCEDENLTCPAGYKRVSNTKYCSKIPPVCPSGYAMTSNNQCARTIQKCPTNSYQQYGRCVTSSFVCPPESQQEGNECISEETVNVNHYEIKYVPRTVKSLQPNPISEPCSSGVPQCPFSNCGYGQTLQSTLDP